MTTEFRTGWREATRSHSYLPKLRPATRFSTRAWTQLRPKRRLVKSGPGTRKADGPRLNSSPAPGGGGGVRETSETQLGGSRTRISWRRNFGDHSGGQAATGARGARGDGAAHPLPGCLGFPVWQPFLPRGVLVTPPRWLGRCEVRFVVLDRFAWCQGARGGQREGAEWGRGGFGARCGRVPRQWPVWRGETEPPGYFFSCWRRSQWEVELKPERRARGQGSRERPDGDRSRRTPDIIDGVTRTRWRRICDAGGMAFPRSARRARSGFGHC